MRYAVLLGLIIWLLGGQSALAQALPPAPRLRADSLAAAPLDTAAALHSYFAQRRHNGHVSLGVGAGVLVVGYAVAAANDKGGYKSLAPFVLGALGVIISVPIIVRGAVLTATHSGRRERRVLRAWQQHRLPSRWARRALVPARTPRGR